MATETSSSAEVTGRVKESERERERERERAEAEEDGSLLHQPYGLATTLITVTRQRDAGETIGNKHSSYSLLLGHFSCCYGAALWGNYASWFYKFQSCVHPLIKSKVFVKYQISPLLHCIQGQGILSYAFLQRSQPCTPTLITPHAYLKHVLLSFPQAAANVADQHTHPSVTNNHNTLTSSPDILTPPYAVLLFNPPSFLSENMLPDVLSHKYGRYKEDTNKFITWLVDTAKNYGHVTPSPVLALATSTPRLKGRARKDAQKTASMSKNMGWEVRGKVSLQDIIDLAKTIVGNSSRKDPLQVPQYMLKIARNAIDARRKFVEWFQTQVVDQPALEENNKRHPYFVQILEEALALLTPYVMASLKENAVPVQPVSSIIAETPCKTLNNLFNNLEMDDSQDHDLLGAATIDVQDVGTV